MLLNYPAGYTDVIGELSSVMAHLDCIFALASLAVSAPIPYCRPRMLERGKGAMKLEKCRHPCVELQNELSFIPNDCHFDAG